MSEMPAGEGNTPSPELGEGVVEATGETVGEAKWAAVRELERLHPGLDKAEVSFEVLSEGERGLLGVGYSPARVIARAERAPATPAPALEERERRQRVVDVDPPELVRISDRRQPGSVGKCLEPGPETRVADLRRG